MVSEKGKARNRILVVKTSYNSTKKNQGKDVPGGNFNNVCSASRATSPSRLLSDLDAEIRAAFNRLARVMDRVGVVRGVKSRVPCL